MYRTVWYRKVKTLETVNPESSISQKQYPAKLEEYVKEKVEANGKGGRPHILSVVAKAGRDPKEEILNIIERAWIKNQGLKAIAKDYETKRQNIYRTLFDIERLTPTIKEEIIAYIRTASRRKRWYIEETDHSDFDTVQKYINRAKRDGVRKYRKNIKGAEKIWIALDRKDPQYWTADDICAYLATLTPGSQSGALDAIRQIAPHLKDEVKTGRYREKLGIRKKDVFGHEVQMIRKALENYPEELIAFDLHISIGCREGAENPNSGLTGLKWENFKAEFTRLDDYESKVRGGITWRDCPVDIFFADLPQRLKELWTKRGKPTSDKIFPDGYKQIRKIYKTIRTVLETTYTGNVDPSLLKEFITLKPHEADKIHVNLLWEAEIPLEIVGGQFLGKGEGLGLMGRGWNDINVIKKHYLSLTGRSDRMKKEQNKVRTYSQRFRDGQTATESVTVATEIPESVEAPRVTTQNGFTPSGAR
jgi:hypothetical protein